jgi:transposase
MAGKTKKNRTVRRREIPIDELKAAVGRALALGLSDEDFSKLDGAIDTLAFVTQELEAKGASIRRLRKLLFGASTEKTSQVLDEQESDEPVGGPQSSDPPADPVANDAVSASGEGEAKSKPKRKGHGRNGAKSYTGAKKVLVHHDSIGHGQRCPLCEKGKCYKLLEPSVIVRILGMAPLSATVYECERFRCNLCGEVFTAAAPEGIGDEKYDETAASMIALFKYGCGMPFHRLEGLQEDLGIPLPSSTQWEVVERAADLIVPAYNELVRQAAQGELVHNDDTTMKILDLPPLPVEGGDDRTGVYTSGIVSVGDGHRIALFFTGHQHAGENLADVLERRASELKAPIQMCDGLSHNTAGEFDSIVANCIPHARRKFVDVVDAFPEECRVVLEALRDVYRFEAKAKERELTPDERLRFHQEHSEPVMDKLQKWLQAQLDEHRVEPNSGVGEAMRYMLKHWLELTLFLRVPGAPLDNNICERALKKAILHRKNSMFYKTENGARVGDMFMSLIHTAELCEANPFDYLVALQRHVQEVIRDPGAWMPWNFRDTLAGFEAARAAPS